MTGVGDAATEVGMPPLLVVTSILLASVLLKIALILHLDGRVYMDVARSINYGLGIESAVISVDTHVDNTKSFLGPLLSIALFHLGGIGAIKLYNIVVFACLFLVMYLIGRGRFDEPVVHIALLLFAFYPGSHRNIVAGEIEDNTASLLFAVAILLYIQARLVWVPSLLLGLAFLIKFWIALFAGAVCLFLLIERRWRDLLIGAAIAPLPFIVINFVDGFGTLSSLSMTLDRQQGYSDWPLVGFKLLSTGLLIAVCASAWTLYRKRDATTRLFFLIPLVYLSYVILFRDAHAVSFVMMLCLVFAGFLIACFLTGSRLIGAAERYGRARLAVVLGLYVLVGSAIAYHNLYNDTMSFEPSPGKWAQPIG
jgi:hypothetical protein